MHISKMSHRHSSGEATVCRVSPTAAGALNIGAKNVSFRKGLEGTGGEAEREGVRRTEHLGQISRQGHLQVST